MKLPQRPIEHNLEELSLRFFKNLLPTNWTTTTPENDYGIDEIIHIFQGANASPYEINVQLKSSQLADMSETERVKLRISTYNHLNHHMNVAIIIKYVAELNEAYWILLVDIPEPNQAKTTFTIHIPKINTLSSIIWQDIENYVTEIVDYKYRSANDIRNRRKNHRM